MLQQLSLKFTCPWYRFSKPVIYVPLYFPAQRTEYVDNQPPHSSESEKSSRCLAEVNLKLSRQRHHV